MRRPTGRPGLPCRCMAWRQSRSACWARAHLRGAGNRKKEIRMNDVMLDRNGNGPPAASLQADAAGIRALLSGRLGDPFRLLGPHRLAGGDRYEIRVFQPGALGVEIL